MMKKIILLILMFFCVALVVVYMYLYSSIQLPRGIHEVIQSALQHEPREEIRGETGFAMNEGVQIWYESISPQTTQSPEAIVLLMGISSDAMAWPDYFFMPLVDSGYQVIRYDYRGTGMSDWMEDWRPEDPYSLKDLATDVIAILDTLKLEKAHILGVSMGGMVAQEVAIQYPERAHSLISMMSSAYIEDPAMPGMSPSYLASVIKMGIFYGLNPSESNLIKLHAGARELLKGGHPYELNLSDIANEVIYNVRERKGYNLHVSQQHSAAVSSSGPRYEALGQLTLPTLIVHGTTDPLIPFAHGTKCAQLIPHADTLWVEGMGHDIPPLFVDQVLTAIYGHLKGIPDTSK